MDIVAEGSGICYSVRKFSLPPSTDSVIMVFAVFAVIINVLVLISVLRNYRRLRQRIYIFVVSLAVANLLGGVVYLVDAALRVSKDSRESDVRKYFFKSYEIGEYVMLTRPIEDQFTAREVLEVLKSGCIVLSVLSTALMAFALYKRTTSMGKHHEDFRAMDNAIGPDGRPFLPAFDTMMRVLSIGTPVVSKKNPYKNSGHYTHDNGELRRTSSLSRASYTSSMQPDEVGLDTKKPQIFKSTSEHNTCRNKTNGKPARSSSLGRLMSSGGRRVSHALRSRSASGSQPYVGKHSNSVMSEGATKCSLFLVWLTFLAACAIPPVLHRNRSSASCSSQCRAFHIFKVRPIINDTEGNFSVSFKNDTSSCIPFETEQVPSNYNTDDSETTGFMHLPCSPCSSAFFPLSKSHPMFVVCVMIITWLWLMTSSARLLYLRKHSSNVFVRCSALWRFMFLTALLYFITLFPYIVWISLDFKTASPAMRSPLWYSTDDQEESETRTVNDYDLQILERDSTNLHPCFGAISICLLLLYLTVLPSLYLVRLLGFRRIISSV